MSLDPLTIAPRPPEQLGDIELLALALNRSLTAAATLLSRFGGVHGLARAAPDELLRERVPPRARAPAPRRARARPPQPRRAAAARRRSLTDAGARRAAHAGAPGATVSQEELHVVGLDVRHRVLIEFVAAIGTSPRSTSTRATSTARSCARTPPPAIVVHNHPSGATAPSDSDRRADAQAGRRRRAPRRQAPRSHHRGPRKAPSASPRHGRMPPCTRWNARMLDTPRRWIRWARRMRLSRSRRSTRVSRHCRLPGAGAVRLRRRAPHGHGRGAARDGRRAHRARS